MTNYQRLMKQASDLRQLYKQSEDPPRDLLGPVRRTCMPPASTAPNPSPEKLPKEVKPDKVLANLPLGFIRRPPAPVPPGVHPGVIDIRPPQFPGS